MRVTKTPIHINRKGWKFGLASISKGPRFPVLVQPHTP